MDLRFFEVSEAGIRIMCPSSDEKLMLVGETCRQLGYMQPGIRLLDLACGQGEMLSRWAQTYGITGTGVDLSQAFIDMACRRAAELGVAAQLEFVEGDASQYPQGSPAYDVVSCIGATWIGGGLAGTINLMRQALKDEHSGLLLVGDIFWEKEPNDMAAKAMGVKADDVPTLPQMLDLFDDAGVMLLDMVLADLADWDRYQTYHWLSIYQWLQDHPDDPDAPEFKLQVEDWKRSYLTYRGYIGHGIFVLQVKEMMTHG
jgi:SAM-dependent methyltransferase